MGKAKIKETARPLLLVSAIVFIIACERGPAPEPFEYTEDRCDYCDMFIDKPGFGAEIYTIDHALFKFDAVECLAAFQLQRKIDADSIRFRWVTNYNRPEHFLNAAEAVYIRSSTIRSPMGMNLSAFANREKAQRVQSTHRGDILDWEGVLALVNRTWFKNKF